MCLSHKKGLYSNYWQTLRRRNWRCLIVDFGRIKNESPTMYKPNYSYISYSEILAFFINFNRQGKNPDLFP